MLFDLGVVRRIILTNNPPRPPKNENALRFGILGAARIAPDALIKPALNHADVKIVAVAARDKGRADAFAKKWGISKVYHGKDGYQELLNDKDIDVIYNPLPNGLHFEWTAKALLAGKHVLLEKPSTNTEEEIRKLFELANAKGLVLLEAFHSRFHPAMNRVKEIIDSGELGKLKSLHCGLCVPWQMHMFSNDDIRYKYELGGGTLMDMGCYALACVRFLASSNPSSILSASADPFPGTPAQEGTIDVGTRASLAFPNDVTADIECHSRWEGWGPFGLLLRFPNVNVEARCEGGVVKLTNFVLPTLLHELRTEKWGEGKKEVKVEKVFTKEGWKGEDWWMTYRYQLEVFVDKIRGREPQCWVSAEDSIANMEWIEKIYKQTGMGSRPKSDYVPPE